MRRFAFAAAGLVAALLGAAPAFATGLEPIRARGKLRVLVNGGGEQQLPRQGRPETADRELAAEFARRLGVEVALVPVPAFDQLLPRLLAGDGDLVAASLTVTPERQAQVAFTRPVATVEEILVARRGGKGAPKSLEELAGQKVHVRPSSSYAGTLRSLAAGAARGVELVDVPETMDEEQIVYEVTRGQRPLTVVDSDLLRAIQTYNADAEGLFPLAHGRQIAWAVRKDETELLAAANAFIIEQALTGHTKDVLLGDLDAIRQRKVLRVLTRNNPVTYFLYRGEQLGFEFELARLLAKSLGVRLEMIVAPSRDLLLPWLLEGRGDLIAASLTRTPEREAQIRFSRPYLETDEILVVRRGKGVVAPKTQEELKGKVVHVRKSSSYYATLQRLAAGLGGDLKIVEEPEELETEQILAKLAAGQIPLTVADSHILDVELTYRDDIEGAFPLPTVTGARNAIGFGLRPGDAQLLAAVDAFLAKTLNGLEYNMAKKRYFQNKRQILAAKEQNVSTSGVFSPYDDLIRRYATRYGFDWRLMAAQAHQESRMDPDAKSWVGALGLFQVMPQTGLELGFTDLRDPEQGVHAGIKYMDWLVRQFDPKIPFKHRVRFALASYNVGRGHVLDAQRLAVQLGLDPMKWFGHVEKAMLLLEDPKYHKAARNGYCRGGEPVAYVSQIQTRYDALVGLTKK